MYLKKKEKKKKASTELPFPDKEAFFFPFGKELWAPSQGATYQLFDIRGGPRASAGPAGTPGSWQGTEWSLSYQLAGSGTSSTTVWKKKAREKAGEGRKVCVTGREETKGDPWARLNMAGLYLGLLCCLLLLKITTAVSPAFHGRGMTSHLFSCEAEQRAHWGDNAPFQTQLGERVAKEIGNMTHSLKSLSR